MYTVLTHNADGSITLTGLFRSEEKAERYAQQLRSRGLEESYAYLIDARETF